MKLTDVKAAAKAAGYQVSSGTDVLPEDYPFLRAYLNIDKNIPFPQFDDNFLTEHLPEEEKDPSEEPPKEPEPVTPPEGEGDSEEDQEN
jgi:hypothetical protein